MNEIPPHDSRIIPFPMPRRRDVHVSPRLESELRDAIEEGFSALVEDPIDKADLTAIDSEATFLERFGFDAPGQHRRQVIELKHQCDLTDRELRFLNSVGGIAFGTSEARISAPLLLTAWGWVQLACLWALMGFAFLAASRVKAVSLTQVGALATIEFMLLAVGCGVFHLYIRPARIARRVRRRLATAEGARR